jgi:hypothetical protein
LRLPETFNTFAIDVLPDEYEYPVKFCKIEFILTELLFIPIVLFAISVVFVFTDVFNADTKVWTLVILVFCVLFSVSMLLNLVSKLLVEFESNEKIKLLITEPLQTNDPLNS